MSQRFGFIFSYAVLVKSSTASSILTLDLDQLFESAVALHRVHPVSADKFPTATYTEEGSLIQLSESRVSHHQVSRLRQAHGVFRNDASSFFQTSETKSPTRRHGNHDGLSHAFVYDLLDTSANVGHDSLNHAAAIRMTNLRDSQYVGPLKVGSQGDVLSVVYDTGSTNLWFASTLCTEGSCLKRRRYDPKASESFHEGNYDLNVRFGTGELTGRQGIDDVEMANFKVRQQTFSLIEKEKGSIFDELDFEGILGLAFPSMSANGVTPFFDQVIQQSLLETNAISFYFTKLPEDASAVFFGEPNAKLYKGELVGLPVTEQHYWMVDLKNFKLGDKVIDGPKKVVFDSGTTYYTAPKALLPTILAEMPQASCESIRDGTTKLPDLVWTLVGRDGADVQISVKPHDYYVSSGADDHCDPAWMGIEVPSPHGPGYIFGEAFMRSYFTSFHRGDGSTLPEVRFAPSNPKAIQQVKQLRKEEQMSANQRRAASLMSLEDGQLRGRSN